MSYTSRPALAPSFALLFAGYSAAEIETAAAEGLAFFYDLAAAAAEDLGAVLSFPVAAAAAAVRDGAQAAPVAVQDAVEHAAASAEPLPGESVPHVDHLSPAERAAWRLSCALRAPRCLLARILAPLGLSLVALVRSRRRADADAAGLGTTEIRAKGGQSAAYREAQGTRWTGGTGSRKPRADDKATVGVWLDRAEQDRIERAVLALPEDASPAVLARSVLAYC